LEAKAASMGAPALPSATVGAAFEANVVALLGAIEAAALTPIMFAKAPTP